MPPECAGPFRVAADGVPDPQTHKQELSKLFPNLIGRAAVKLQPTDNSHNAEGAGKLTVGIVLSGGQAPGMLFSQGLTFHFTLYRYF